MPSWYYPAVTRFGTIIGQYDRTPLAESICSTPEEISRYKFGHRRPDVPRVLALARAIAKMTREKPEKVLWRLCHAISLDLKDLQKATK